MTFSDLELLEPRTLRAVDLSVASVDFPIGVLGANDTAQVSVSIRNSGGGGRKTPEGRRVY